MTEVTSDFFERKRGTDRDEYEFDSLREEAIRLVQAYSGDVWTDFNIHDPGVTLIEAVCYALTDLVYRTGFPVADYLVTSGGTIDYEQLALFRPDRILPSAPVTTNDYRKILLDVVPHLENVWVENAVLANDLPSGVYNVYLQLSPRVKHQDSESVTSVYVAAVEKAFAENRNLCERLGQVSILKKLPYVVGGRIEIQPGADPAAALAKIYYRCDEYLNPKVEILPYDEVARSGQSLDQILTGPLTTRGYIAEASLHGRPVRFSIPELIKMLNELPEVKNVVDLYFLDEAACRTEIIDLDRGPDFPPASVGVCFPWNDNVESLQLMRAGKFSPVAIHDLESEFGRLAYRDTALREKRTHFDWVDSSLPTGVAREFSDYFSFQHHLPDAYGLNVHGVPHSATNERKTEALQLKAYLFFFDQVMANFLAQVQQIPSLLSTVSHSGRTHFHQLLGNDAIPDVTSLYLESKVAQDNAAAKIRDGVDDPLARRDRFFDYLLGLYGETLDLQVLRELARNIPDIDMALVAAKREYLRTITDLSSMRARGNNFLAESTSDFLASTLQRKIELLLGIETAEFINDSPNLRSVENSRIFVIEHIELQPKGSLGSGNDSLSPDFYASQLSVILSPTIPLTANNEFRQLAVETINEHCPAHIYPHIVWAEANEFSKVSKLFGNWLAVRAVQNVSPEGLTSAQHELALYLSNLHRRRG